MKESIFPSVSSSNFKSCVIDFINSTADGRSLGETDNILLNNPLNSSVVAGISGHRKVLDIAPRDDSNGGFLKHRIYPKTPNAKISTFSASG